MSRILRRPMFRGGRVDSRGTGITSGLADGGRVGMFEGGVSTSMMEELTGGSNFKRTSKPSIASRGMDILRSAKNRIFGIPYAGKFLQTTVGAPMKFMSGIATSAPVLKTAAITAPIAAVGGLAYMNRPKTVEALQFMKSYGSLDETMTEDDYKQYYETIDELNRTGTPLNQSEVGLMSSQKDIADAIEDKDMEEFEKQTSADLSADVNPTSD